MFEHECKWDSCQFYHGLNLLKRKQTHNPIEQSNQRKKKIEKNSTSNSCNLPINGPKHVTNSPLPTICQPNAAGNCSSEQYSETHKVKLLRAIPEKDIHFVVFNQFSATKLNNSIQTTEETANEKPQHQLIEISLFGHDYEKKKTHILTKFQQKLKNNFCYNFFFDCHSLERVMPTNKMETKKIFRFFTLNRSQMGGKMIRAAISEMAVTERQQATSVFA